MRCVGVTVAGTPFLCGGVHSQRIPQPLGQIAVTVLCSRAGGCDPVCTANAQQSCRKADAPVWRRSASLARLAPLAFCWAARYLASLGRFVMSRAAIAVALSLILAAQACAQDGRLQQ